MNLLSIFKGKAKKKDCCQIEIIEIKEEDSSCCSSQSNEEKKEVSK